SVLYPNVTCFSCNVGSGTPVAVGAGTETSGINFALSVFTGGGTGAISGTVKDAATGQPIGGVAVVIVDGQSNFRGVATTDSSGNYGFSGLPTGTYYAATSSASAQGYVDVLFNGTPCQGCFSLVTGTPISVTSGATTPSIDFSLGLAGRVTGRVTSGGVGVGNVLVALVTPTGTFIAQAFTGVDGSYG